MRPLNCFYCKEAKKGSTAHNASLCNNFNDEEFSIVKKKFDQIREDKERGEEAYNIEADEGEEMNSDDEYE